MGRTSCGLQNNQRPLLAQGVVYDIGVSMDCASCNRLDETDGMALFLERRTIVLQWAASASVSHHQWLNHGWQRIALQSVYPGLKQRSLTASTPQVKS